MPPRFEPRGHLIKLPYLDAPGAGALHCIGFRIRGTPGDRWTDRFMSFKRRRSDAVRRGAAVVAHAFQTAQLPLRERVVVVGAISASSEALARENPIHHLGRTLASAFGWEWRPELLSKTVHPPLHTITDMHERDAAVHERYSSAVIGGSTGQFVIVDDLATRGSTFADIRRALLSSNPGWDFLNLALAKNENFGHWDGDISNEHIPAELSKVWQAT